MFYLALCKLFLFCQRGIIIVEAPHLALCQACGLKVPMCERCYWFLLLSYKGGARWMEKEQETGACIGPSYLWACSSIFLSCVTSYSSGPRKMINKKKGRRAQGTDGRKTERVVVELDNDNGTFPCSLGSSSLSGVGSSIKRRERGEERGTTTNISLALSPSSSLSPSLFIAVLSCLPGRRTHRVGELVIPGLHRMT